jgi:hypothetical protein
MGLYKSCLQVRQIMEPDERVFYSCTIEKFNRYGFCQDRVLLVTNKNVFAMTKGQFNYTINRKVPISEVDAITVSKDQKCLEIVVHQVGQPDARYRCSSEHRNNLRRVIAMLSKV